jgi:hypothetical protein
MRVTTPGIDLAKNVFRVHGVDRAREAVLRKKVTRRPSRMRTNADSRR